MWIPALRGQEPCGPRNQPGYRGSGQLLMFSSRSLRNTITRVTDCLFVYGSLRSGFDNPFAKFLHEKAVLIGHATVRGSIYLVGKYPGFKSAPDGIVHGEVWRMGNAEAILAILDDYEGPTYPRIL